MRDIMGMMKQAQSRMQEMQQRVAALEISGAAGGGLVRVTLTGKGEMRGLKIDASLLKPEESEILEDLIVAAHNDARVKVEAEVSKLAQEATGGLQLPPGMKLPF